MVVIRLAPEVFNLLCPLLFSDVAFEVGGDSGVSYLVLQVHYGKVDNFKGELIRNLFPLS